jgi:hypothetical protein
VASQLKAQEARDRVTALEAALAGIRGVEVDGGHIPWTTVTYPNAEVDLDAAGNLMAVRLTSGIERFSVVNP